MNIFEMLNEPYHLPKKVKLFEAFSGIGCQRMAFEKAGIDYEMVGISEIDKYALQSYMSIHGETKNFGSITDIKGKDLPHIDVFTWSFPCTDLSKAGKQAGMSIGTRSGLVYEVLRILHEAKKHDTLPKVLIMENVVDLIQSKFIRQFQEVQLELEEIGYTNYVETMNAKDYGVAQNIDRVFMVSILGDYYYEFPKPFKLDKRLKDYLEDEVDEKYYISEAMMNYLTDKTERNGFVRGDRFRPLDKEASYGMAITTCAGSRPTDNFIKEPMIGYAIKSREFENTGWQEISPTLCDIDYKDPKVVYIPEATENGFYKQAIQTFKSNDCKYGDTINAFNNYVDKSGNSPTITTRQEGKKTAILPITQDLRIRKLTPLECWRLMGIDDEDFYKAEKVVSNSQLYKQAGNGIVVDVFAQIVGAMK